MMRSVAWRITCTGSARRIFSSPIIAEKSTHFGEKTVKAEEKQGLVNTVFNNVADSYDVMNDVMSFGIHRYACNETIDNYFELSDAGKTRSCGSWRLARVPKCWTWQVAQETFPSRRFSTHRKSTASRRPILTSRCQTSTKKCCALVRNALMIATTSMKAA